MQALGVVAEMSDELLPGDGVDALRQVTPAVESGQCGEVTTKPRLIA
ncbi:MAG: hypothetical protein H0T92_03765 [Pyrinomonadaceae bacterium]|nr:hypothetical protein [Pyrinomonadaceae bacterium]